MTSYHISIGYCGGSGTADGAFEKLVTATRALCADPKHIEAEARRLGATEADREGVTIGDYVATYLELDIGQAGHPVRIDAEREEVIQWASTSDGLKYHVRRAFVRLLIEDMHRQCIEVNLHVA